ncbi:hypothetical protein LSAT2_012581 [Lamellibrachia satsuma]|nr:hypothetical protein LSAT2_012581 [Lamellibrachia satsuma]
MIRDWPPSVLERCITNSIPAALKLCLNATDVRTRNIAKDVFCEFAKHFPTNATNLLDELDIKKKLLLTKTLQMKKQQADQPQDDRIQVEVKCAEMPHHQPK